MSDPFRGRAGGAFFATASTAASGGISTTVSGIDGKAATVEHISGSGDAAALVTVESPSNTVLWKQRYNAAFTFFLNFPPGILRGLEDNGVLIKISASTSNVEANIGGYFT